jgi:hypothetical protein
MIGKNTVIGIGILMFGFVISSIGYSRGQNVPITSFGFAVAIMGAMILLLAPEPVPQDAYQALLNDAIGNVETLLEELALREKAYFLQSEDGEIRAFIPTSQPDRANWEKELSSSELLQIKMAPGRIVVDQGDLRGLLLTPPGARLVKLARVEKGADLEKALRSVLIEFSDLASSVLALEEGESKIMKIQIGKPALKWESPSLNNCLGSTVSCIAGCVATVVKGQPVKIVDEKFDPALVHLSLKVV